ncbi:MAG: hypothetical protein PWP46_474 [Fusobacteriaceae bacterium]|jgi:uncharacterized protein GlcG (DUF336 family)|nr:ATP:cob(I)alamin adenosyltransferase [Fusobacteriales bacterium]MDN5303595.1 hypothetical protein [Fusobacteriaceae bacterium]
MYIKPSKKLTLKAAIKMSEKALKKSEEIGKPFVVAIVDAGGNLIYLHRMEDAFFTSVGIATDKAFTAAALKKGTHELTNRVKPEHDLFGLNITNNGRIITFGGGLPIIVENEVIGGIGVSGGTVDEDIAVATAALEILKEI